MDRGRERVGSNSLFVSSYVRGMKYKEGSYNLRPGF